MFDEPTGPWPPPSPEMIRLSKHFGGVHEDGAVVPSQLGNAAVDLSRRILSTYEGRKNGAGHRFAFDVQHFCDWRPTALCGTVDERQCIATFIGLHDKIFELCCVAVDCYYDLKSKWPPELVSALSIGDTYKRVLSEGTPQRFTAAQKQYFDTFLVGFEEEHSRALASIVNHVTFFVLSHEMKHALDGHTLLLRETSGLQFLAESCTLYDHQDIDEMQMFCELTADNAAMAALLASIVHGHEMFTEADAAPFLPTEERLALVWFAILLLAFTWYRDDVVRGWTASHPFGTDRIINLHWAATGIPVETRAQQKLILETAERVAWLAVRLQERGKEFGSIALAHTADGRDRYQKIQSLMRSDAVWKGLHRMKDLSFTYSEAQGETEPG